MTRMALLGIATVIVLSGCIFCNADPASAESLKINRLILHDVHGLWGGRNIFLSRDGLLWVQVVKTPAAGESGL